MPAIVIGFEMFDYNDANMFYANGSDFTKIMSVHSENLTDVLFVKLKDFNVNKVVLIGTAREFLENIKDNIITANKVEYGFENLIVEVV